ncbi:MAG: hypothetical protein IKU24_05070 [Clostridia bacterium]|nr:hypothetical protein [Clostridia bacterium]
MSSFSRNLGLILKTFLYQIVMSLFGFMMYGATYKIPFLLIIGQLTVVLFYFYTLCSQMYQGGAKTCEYDNAHKEKSSALAGFLFALIAFLPTICLAVISTVSPPFASDGATNTAGYLSYLGNHTFLQGMYVGITQHLFPTVSGGASDAVSFANIASINSRCFVHLFGALPGIFASGISYFVGYRNFKREKK